MPIAIGNLGTGHDSIVRLKEEYDFATLGTNVTFVNLRRLAHEFGLQKNSVKMGNASSNELGYVKETTKFATGRFAFQLDPESIGWILKAIMGSSSADSPATYSVSALTTTGYMHTFKFGSACKTFTIYDDKGGMDTPYYQESSGMLPINLAILMGMNEVVNSTLEFVGKTCIADSSAFVATISGASKASPCSITAAAHEFMTGDTVKITSVVGMTELNNKNYVITKTGANSFTLDGIDSSGYTTYTSGGSATLKNIPVESDDKMIPYNGISFYTDPAGEEHIADMTQWKDPFDFDLSLLRLDAEAKNWCSDGTGLPAAIYAGVPGVTMSLTAIMKSVDGSYVGHKLGDYVAGTEFAFGIVLDSGKTGLGAGGTTAYKIEIVFPRVRYEDYKIRLSAGREATCQIPIEVMKDPTLGYSMAIKLYNNTATYPDASV
jgi:hypothetical protein